MDEFIKWLGESIEWIFSGIGVVIVIWIGRVIYQGRNAVSSQKIRSGSKSKNIQAGRDVLIESKSKRDNVEER